MVRAPTVRPSDRRIAFLQSLDARDEPVGNPVVLRPRRGSRRGSAAVFFADPSIDAVSLLIVGRPGSTQRPAGPIAIRPIRATTATLLLFARHPDAPARLLASLVDGRHRPFRETLRSILAELISPAPRPLPYARWLDLFETWPDDERPIGPSREPTIVALVFGPIRPAAALEATLASLAGQQDGPVPVRSVAGGRDAARAAASLLAAHPGAFVAVLQAGEVLPPHAVAVAGTVLEEAGRPPFAITDTDELDDADHRGGPEFRPVPNRPLMLSGTLSRGLWLVRPDVLARALASGDTAAVAAGWAEALRLAVWFDAWQRDRQGGIRIPHILCSRRPDTDAAPAALLAAIANRHLERAGLPFRATSTVPSRLEPQARAKVTSVTAIVPSTLTAPHAERCLHDVLRTTASDHFDMVVAVAAPTATPASRAVAERLEAAHRNLRVAFLPAARFNFSWAVNRAAALATGMTLLLLNDDVWPTAPDWLERMTGWLADPVVGAVGARLLYPDNTIQHAGVVMGLGGLCEHAHRHRPGQDPGPGFRAQLPQTLLAVTGACMLVPATLWHELGGLDESYPSAFNDVDLCLRIGERGRDVVLSDATLWHEESKTYGSHWDGVPDGVEATTAERLRRRWPAAMVDDPYYNPNLDLRPDRAWTASCPPRRWSAAGATVGTTAPAPWLRAADRLRDVGWPSPNAGAGRERWAWRRSLPATSRA